MKKVVLMALVVFAGASFSTVSAQNSKNKKNKDQVGVVEEKVSLANTSDSVSYAAGMAMTRGLEGYIENQFGVKKEQLPDFMRGLKEGIARSKEAAFSPYTAGLQIAAQVEKNMLPGITKQFEGTDEEINVDMLLKGFVAALEKDTTVLKQGDAEQFFQEKQMKVKVQKEMAMKAKGEKFLADNKTKPGVVTLPSGLQYKILIKGTGKIPTVSDRVTVVYEGRTIDGKVFDATSRHGTSNDTFGVGGLIKGWTEALTMMPVGSKWELYVPQHLAYGERGAGADIAPYSTLIFTLELQGIEKKPEASAQPKPATASQKPAQGKATATQGAATTARTSAKKAAVRAKKK